MHRVIKLLRYLHQKNTSTVNSFYHKSNNKKLVSWPHCKKSSKSLECYYFKICVEAIPPRPTSLLICDQKLLILTKFEIAHCEHVAGLRHSQASPGKTNCQMWRSNNALSKANIIVLFRAIQTSAGDSRVDNKFRWMCCKFSSDRATSFR